MSNQLCSDKLTFANLVSQFTGVSISKINNFISNNGVEMLFEHPTGIGLTPAQLDKFNRLKELSSLYHNLKNQKNEYCIKSVEQAGEYFKNYFCGTNDKEIFVCSFLDTVNKIMATEVMSLGTVNEAPVYPREIMKRALLYDAKSLIIAHNHPGKTLFPSTADINITKKIVEAAEAVNIKLFDHIIVAGYEYYSFAEKGILHGKSADLTNDWHEDEGIFEI